MRPTCELTCSAECRGALVDRLDRMAGNGELRWQGWDVFHDGEIFEDALHGTAGEAWERGWKSAERGGFKP